MSFIRLLYEKCQLVFEFRIEKKAKHWMTYAEETVCCDHFLVLQLHPRTVDQSQQNTK